MVSFLGRKFSRIGQCLFQQPVSLPINAREDCSYRESLRGHEFFLTKTQIKKRYF